MILDYKADPHTAARFDVVWMHNYQHVDMPIFYADDSTGLVRRYVRDPDGLFLKNDAGDGPRVEELRLPIRVVRKSPEEVARLDAGDLLEAQQQAECERQYDRAIARGLALFTPSREECPACQAHIRQAMAIQARRTTRLEIDDRDACAVHPIGFDEAFPPEPPDPPK